MLEAAISEVPDPGNDGNLSKEDVVKQICQDYSIDTGLW
jgi:hypothetical protein